MKHLKRFNESKEHKVDELAKLVVKFLELMKEKRFVSIGDFTLVPSNSDKNLIKVSENNKPLYSIWVQETESVRGGQSYGEFRVGGGIFGYYPGEYHTFAIVGGNSTYITEKDDHKKCISKFRDIIKSLESGKIGKRGKFKFPIPDLSPAPKRKPIKIDKSLLSPETLKVFQDLLKKRD